MRNLLAFSAMTLICAGGLLAAPIDPPSFDDFPYPGDGLMFSLPDPICVDIGGHHDCIENAQLEATSPDTESWVVAYENDTYTGVLTGDFYQDGTLSGSVSLSGTIDSHLDGRSDGSDYGTFNSSMPGLDLSGTIGSYSGELKLDPSQVPPITPTEIDAPVGGVFSITSFFDVFTELSLDGGTTFTPATGQTTLNLVQSPEPGTLMMGLTGAAVLLLFLRKQRSN